MEPGREEALALRLRGTFSNNTRVRPLLEGVVRATGIEIDWELGSPAELHERHLRDNEFDVFEFSISHYMTTKQRPLNRWDLVAVPVFMSKALLCLGSLANVESRVDGPQDLKGKTFGVPDYSMTAATWFRAMLRQLYGIHTWDMSWCVGRLTEASHTALLGLEDELPPNIRIDWPNRVGALAEMLLKGEVDAAWGDSNTIILDETAPNLKPLFPDGGKDFVGAFVQQTGFLPVNHTVVLQRRILEANPWVAESLFEAFEKSKQEAYRRDPAAASVLGNRVPAEWQREAFGDDPYPLGLAANRAMLVMGSEQSVEDGTIPKPSDIDGIFAESLQGT